MIFFFSTIIISNGLPKQIKKLVDKEIERTFEKEDFKLDEFIISSEAQKQVPSKFNEDNFFKILLGEDLLGYAYLSKASSKTAQFDYLVLFNPDLSIARSKVLIYREEYGGEIGSVRWLKQFIGKQPSDHLEYGNDIAAISGATISVKSFTNAVNDLLESLKILQSKHVL